jgi:His-Xaa-Ser system radical SAM maturase HxsC
MLGIPIYGAEAAAHDEVVQAAGAFDETILGILRLVEQGVRVEIRVVMQQKTADTLPSIVEYIVRNLPFVDQVALMGLELMGFARSNSDSVWIDPRSYAETLADAVETLHGAGMRALIFNHPLCVLPARAWPHAVASISDWKNDYLDECRRCQVQARCGGLFSSGLVKGATYIEALAADGRPLGSRSVDFERPAEQPVVVRHAREPAPS